MAERLGSIICSNFSFQILCTYFNWNKSFGLCSSSLLNGLFCLKLAYELCVLGELIHRKCIYSEVETLGWKPRGFSRAVKTTQLSCNSNFSFQNLEAIDTSDMLSECSGISPLGRQCMKKPLELTLDINTTIHWKILKYCMHPGAKSATINLFLSKALLLWLVSQGPASKTTR